MIHDNELNCTPPVASLYMLFEYLDNHQNTGDRGETGIFELCLYLILDFSTSTFWKYLEL